MLVSKRAFTLKDMCISAVFAAFVCIATIVLKVDIPQTNGYFNIGDSMVYITALLFGPLVGGIAGGVGSMLGDLILGAFAFAPGTLVIKSIEGCLVGYISHKPNPLGKWKRLWKMLTVLLAIVLALLIYYLGSVFYTAEWQFKPMGIYVGAIQTNPLFWAVVAILLEAFIIYVGVGVDPEVAWHGLAIVLGGVNMILGYFIYEFYALSLGFSALAEVPFNIGQAIIGLALAIPVVKAISKAIQWSGYPLKE